MEASGLPVSSILSALRKVTPLPADSEFFLLFAENGILVLLFVLAYGMNLCNVTHRIRKHVVHGDPKEAWRLKESYRDTFALQAVSAAIIAQISITMLGLDNMGNIHWSATAFTYMSMVSGILSTYCAFYIQERLSTLHSPEDVRDWLLSRPNEPLVWLSYTFTGPLQRTTDNDHHNRNNRIPSILVASALSAPSALLRLSIVFCFVAMALYLVFMYTENLGSLTGRDANMAVLIMVCIYSISLIPRVYLPIHLRPGARNASLVMSDPGRHYGAAARVSGGTGNLSDDIRDALQASIRAQETLKALEALLELWESQLRMQNGVEDHRGG
ncbi:hypothetical protein P170DRAFT_510822 [Aspergillus steynii IBT 23096]|uniref:Uncharacterized protein n=1 Tax=Aspergillus steynii IBT 23096 TaxID=1392250 RepID=A0A2I2G5L3_9EURO|nr:uncharacterized protein P170DRAFT_510822 [Aspergillus steynii IBT 23096]PLB48133.1 hypothetical protein P170DRAFT_510822 [Aspergillus steynii IBT 23096]